MNNIKCLKNINSVEVAVRLAGGQSALARKMGVSQPAVHQWIQTGVPAGRVDEVSAYTGVPKEKLLACLPF